MSAQIPVDRSQARTEFNQEDLRWTALLGRKSTRWQHAAGNNHIAISACPWQLVWGWVPKRVYVQTSHSCVYTRKNRFFIKLCVYFPWSHILRISTRIHIIVRYIVLKWNSRYILVFDEQNSGILFLLQHDNLEKNLAISEWYFNHLWMYSNGSCASTWTFCLLTQTETFCKRKTLALGCLHSAGSGRSAE